MPRPENIEPHKWSKGQSGNPNGRPKKVLRKLEEMIGQQFKVQLSKEDKLRIIESMLELSLSQLQAVATDKETPVFMVVLATAIKGDIERKQMRTVDELFARFWGRPGKAADMEKGEHSSDPMAEFF